MISTREEFFSQYIDKVQSRVEVLYQDAQRFPEQHSQQLVASLEELRLAVEELHVAEEELISQNEQLSEAQFQAESERQRYRDLFEFAPDGYVVTDPFGVVREANRAAAILFQVSQDHLLGKPMITYIPSQGRKAFRTLLNQIFKVHRIQGWELQVQGRRQTPITLAVTLATVQSKEGHPIALRWQLRDISDLKQAEASLRQLQAQNLELLEVDRLRNQFLATVSHELRTPMNSILGFSQMLIKQFREQQDIRTTAMVERIFHNGQHLLHMIEDMLNFSRLRARHIELNPEGFDLIELITTTLEELRPLAEQKALILATDFLDGTCLITNDRCRLRQILINLLSNAIKFTDTGQVVVKLRLLSTQRLLLVVQDTGVGISDEDQEHIFQEFWQVQSARHQSQGTGLGLAIVNALVDAMQGAISVESQLGQGSLFHIELPRNITPIDPTN